MRHSFVTNQWVPYPVELVFDFLVNPQNLPPLMPAWQKTRIEDAKIVAPPERPASQVTRRLRSIAAGTGSVITISFRPFRLSPMRVPWEATISEFVWNDHFCDELSRGPFAYWKHCHRVRAERLEGKAGCLIIDDVIYELKMGALGEMARRAFAEKQIKQLFAHRQMQVERFLAVMAKVSLK
jgi:ligand-binding SRPBCC domain-containing protein